MDTAEFADLAKDLAARLGDLRGEQWTAEPDERYQAGAVLAHGIARLHVSWDHRERKLRVAGLGPDGSQLGRWSINANPERGAAVVAKDIARRILGAGYLDDLLVARAKKADRDERDAKRAAWLAQAAELFGIEPPAGGRQGLARLTEGRLHLQQFVKGSGYVEAYGYGDGDTDHLSINLSGIPAEVALGMLKVLAGSADVLARCCSTYGPNHHPSLSTAGCPYPDGTGRYRGEMPSRANVLGYLVRSHGVTAYAAALALNQARESDYQCAEITDGERTVAVITWDHAGLGEYTVEIPRKDAS